MRASVFLGCGAAAIVVVVACAPTTPLPPASGDCTPVEGGTCQVGASSGSSGGEGGADGGSCSVSAGSSQCGVCETDDCCSELEECFSGTTSGSTDCQNLYNCEEDCTGASSCITACQQQFPTAVSTLQLVASCVTRSCPVCDESGVGDPCGPIYPACEVGLTCNGLWCTKPCVRSSDCAGLGAGGDNSLGYPGVCMATASGDKCTPGCSQGDGCADFAGTYCLGTTAVDGTSVSVCAVLPDASTKD